MIPAEQRARIRRLYFAEHWKIGTIAAELGYITTRSGLRSSRTDSFPSGDPRGRRVSTRTSPWSSKHSSSIRVFARRGCSRCSSPRVFGKPAAGPSLRENRPAARRARSVLSIGHTPRRARPSRLGQLRHNSRRPRRAQAVVLRHGPVVLTRPLRALCPRPDARELPSRTRSSLRSVWQLAATAPREKRVSCSPPTSRSRTGPRSSPTPPAPPPSSTASSITPTSSPSKAKATGCVRPKSVPESAANCRRIMIHSCTACPQTCHWSASWGRS